MDQVAEARLRPLSDRLLLLGPLASAVSVIGVVGLATMVPGYDWVRQTLSEIGEEGSPARVPFTLALCAVALCILGFAAALRGCARERGHSAIAAYLTGCMAVSCAGVGIFAFPHPLHNVFGLSELIGYQAPLFLALSWRRDPDAKRLVNFSWAMTFLTWAAIAVNLIPVVRDHVLWPLLKPSFGIVQRSLFASWFAWSAGTGWLLFRLRRAR